MDLKEIQEKLKLLRDRIKEDGKISPSAEMELKSILNDTLVSAQSELNTLQDKLSFQMSARAGNDNTKPALSEEQIRRLSIIEKTGTGSYVVH